MQKETEHKHHDHAREPITKIEPQLPEHVLRLIALGESLGVKGITVAEESRLKADELNSKGLAKGLPYFKKRIMTMQGVLSDRKILSKDEVQRKIGELKNNRGYQGWKHFRWLSLL